MIFLGGTCGNNDWRDRMIPALIAQGIPASALFNPVVAHWTPDVQRREDAIKADARTLTLYVIASPDPQSSTTNVSAYSISEALMSLYDCPGRTVVVFDYQGWPRGTVKRIEKIAQDWRGRFPDAPIYEDYASAAQCLAALFHRT